MRPRRSVSLVLIGLAAVGCAGPRATAPVEAPNRETAGALNCRLQVRFHGMASDDGRLIFALFDDETGFTASAEPARRGSLSVAGGEARQTIRLPSGDYAIKAYHDVNGNGELDKGALGVPVEAYGFSNDARGRFGPPSWSEARFRLDGPKQLEIRLR